MMVPEPHGHSPAMARISVDLPVPDLPLTITISPGEMVNAASAISARPVWRRTATFSRCSLSSVLCLISMRLSASSLEAADWM